MLKISAAMSRMARDVLRHCNPGNHFCAAFESDARALLLQFFPLNQGASNTTHIKYSVTD
jgi:hypothetical protein